MNKLSVILLLSGFLSGCVSMSTSTPTTGSFKTESVTQRQIQLDAIKSWTASGAISIQQAAKSPVIMRYDWEQRGADHYHINLAASLNLAAISITGKPNRVILQRDNEPPVSAATPEELMQKNLGWSLPIPSLWYWARGLPAPGEKQGAQYDRYGHLIFLQQTGWRVQYSGYQTVQGVDLPQVIELRRADVLAKVVIKQWKIS